MKNTVIPAETKADEINFTSKVFAWMAAGLFISGVVAFKLFQNYYLVQFVMNNYFVFGILVLVHLGIVIWLSLNIEKIDSSKIMLFFFGFATLNGLILSLIFQFFTQNFIISTFFILAGMFGVMSAILYFFKQNLVIWQSLILMVIIGIIINILLNFVWRNDQFQLITSTIAVVVFVGIIAYDSKKIKEIDNIFGVKERQKVAIMGAFTLYLDLYYLFLAIVLAVNKRDKKSSS